MNLFSEYEKTLRKSVARIRFRRWVVRHESIPMMTQNYDSTILYNPTDFPCRCKKFWSIIRKSLDNNIFFCSQYLLDSVKLLGNTDL